MIMPAPISESVLIISAQSSISLMIAALTQRIGAAISISIRCSALVIDDDDVMVNLQTENLKLQYYTLQQNIRFIFASFNTILQNNRKINIFQ